MNGSLRLTVMHSCVTHTSQTDAWRSKGPNVHRTIQFVRAVHWALSICSIKELETHAAMERLAADSGLTSATSLAFCRAIFLLAACSSSCSSCTDRQRGGREIKSKRWIRREISANEGNRKETEMLVKTVTAVNLGQLLCVGQIVHSDGQEHIEQSVWAQS